MDMFTPHRVPSSYHFLIRPDRRGHWIVRERSNLVGGLFLTRDGAMKFALCEAGGNVAQVSARQGSARRRGHAS